MTLLELLVVLAIIGLLASLIFPAFAQAKARAREAVCTSNMRQVGMAVQAYISDYHGLPPYLHRMLDTGHAAGDVLVCPSDPLADTMGYGEAFERVLRPPQFQSQRPVSYLYWQVGSLANLNRLVTKKPGAGYTLCVLHGTLVSPAWSDPPSYQGRFVRLRPDGAVKRVQVSWEPRTHSCTERYFTSEPCRSELRERGEPQP
ncbi:MAG: type II secretion system protein [Rubrivivax sp.]|nr:type II secretion system protein [Rubrivivax sp.]